MKDAFRTSMSLFFRLSWRTFFGSKGTQARLTPKRFVVMSLFLPVFFMIQLMHWIGFFLDDILFRGYRNVRIEEPLFIVGVPRSGTTFLHRVLAHDTERFTTLTLWELVLAPSVTERMVWLGLAKCDRLVGSPFAKLIDWIEQFAFHHLDGIHRVSLNAPEEDYFLFVPLFACFIMILPFPFPEIQRMAYFDDEVPEHEQRMMMAFYKSCLQRHLYVRGPEKQILSKNVSFSPMIRALNQAFPDCKIVCNLRTPLKVVPSNLSSMLSGIELFDNDVQEHVFRDRLINLIHYSYRHLLTTLPVWPENRHIFVTMEALKEDLQDSVQTIYQRFEYQIVESFEICLQHEAQKSQRYSSRHSYSLEQFDLRQETLVEEFSDVFARFDFTRNTTNSSVAVRQF